jgi:SAM-dependent methyltransferase
VSIGRGDVVTELELPTCRFCGEALRRTVVDLGMSPLCESYVDATRLDEMEPFYPLHVRICESCFLVQLRTYVHPVDIFSEYAYFSSYSSSWVEHAREYTDMIVERFGLGRACSVVELGSNDGYLLREFVERGIPALGIEPAGNVAEVAVRQGIPTVVDFFGVGVARRLVNKGHRPDLLVANNVLAQAPELNDFVAGMKVLLAPQGVATIEVPHLMRLLEGNQFDTIYHEHYSYFSLATLVRIFAAHGLAIFDVEELPTHGGSIRFYARHAEATAPPVEARVADLLAREDATGLSTLEPYTSFAARVEETKRRLLELLITIKRGGKSIAGYGAPGKGNTLLNYCGIRTDLLDYTVDRNPYKQGRFLPGTHIPIAHPTKIAENRPDFILILPWNLKDEIVDQLSFVREWSARFIVPIPDVAVHA